MGGPQGDNGEKKIRKTDNSVRVNNSQKKDSVH